MINSKQKGKKGELEAAKYLAKIFGLPVSRGQQYKGSPDSPDVIGLKGLHVEVKRCERINVDKALEQASRDASITECPIVFHRSNRKPWKVTFYADQLYSFLDRCDELLEESIENCLEK